MSDDGSDFFSVNGGANVFVDQRAADVIAGDIEKGYELIPVEWLRLSYDRFLRGRIAWPDEDF